MYNNTNSNRSMNRGIDVNLKRGHLLSLCMLISSMTFATAPQALKKVRITVFVHGIMSIKPHLSFANFLRFMSDKVEDTFYSETVRFMREDPFFFQNQAMEQIGWHAIDPERIEKGYASGLIARMFDRVEKWSDPCSEYENHYFTYGWYGLLSARIRYFDAIPLYQHLVAEVQKFRAQGIEPEVRVIGYSHGGNVCLNLGAVRQNEAIDQNLRIDELVLLGVPIQCETDFLLADPIFKRVYQVYSRGDRIQKLDFFSTKRFFSRRLFQKRSYFALPDKLTQIQLRCTRNVRSRKSRCQAYCFNPNDISMLSGKSKRLRDASPGHIELWFFGWTPANYRPDFILDPLPIMIFLPIILDQTENTLARAKNANPHKPIIMDIRPEYEHIIIKNQKSFKDVTIVPFPDKQEIQALSKMVDPYVPDVYSAEEYDYHIQQAAQKAQCYMQEKQPVKGRKRRRTATKRIHRHRHPLKAIMIS